jgi:hypothetical protein
MSKSNKNALVFLLWSTLSGTISFFVSSALLAVLMLQIDLMLVGIILAGGIGGLLLAFSLFRKIQIRRIFLAGLFAVPIGFYSAFILAGGVDLLLPLIGIKSNSPSIYNISNIVGIVIMGLICGAICGAIIYGRKGIWLFSAVCSVVSLPFGILVGLFNANHPIKAKIEDLLAFLGPVDLNFLAIVTSLGVGIGLSIGLYNMLNSKKSYE